MIFAPWRVICKKEGVPNLEFKGVEKAHFRDNKIELLVSDFEEEQAQTMLEWIKNHAEEVGLKV